MIARRALVAGLAFVALAAPAQSATDWVNTVAATPEGGILIGNPVAKVRVIEFGSYTCSHCATFDAVGLPALKAKYIASGKVAFEQRSFIRNGPDLSASLLVQCLPPRAALGLAGKLFAEQPQWTAPFVAMTPADRAPGGALPTDKQPGRLAELAGLDRWAAARGVPIAKGKACLADKAAQDRIVATRSNALTRYKLEATPTFVINGATVTDAYDWAALEPKVVAALK